MHGLGRVLEGRTRALVVGLGGGGDVVGTLPTRHLLAAHGIESVLGGVAWQRKPHDPHPGPRPLKDFVRVEPLAGTVGLASGRTRTRDGHADATAHVADVLGEHTLLLDITLGAAGVADGLARAAGALEADLVVGVDVGGDLLAQGDEAGLRSPLCDSVAGAGIAALPAATEGSDGPVACVLASFGLCADGELTLEEVHGRLASLHQAAGYLGAWPLPRDAAEEMERCLKVVPSEASRIPLLAARGERGPVPIRHGTTDAVAHDGSGLTHYVAPDVFLEWSPLGRAVAATDTLEAANEALHAIGVTRTELDIEAYMEAKGLTRYTDVPERGGD